MLACIFPHDHAGPAAYNLPQPIPPAPVIGEKFNLNFDPDYPAPNNYELPSAIGSIGGKTFGVCLEDKTPQESPFGNHSLAQPKMTSHTLTYRAFPQKSESTIWCSHITMLFMIITAWAAMKVYVYE